VLLWPPEEVFVVTVLAAVVGPLRTVVVGPESVVVDGDPTTAPPVDAPLPVAL
jgi:hypothetical protein